MEKVKKISEQMVEKKEILAAATEVASVVQKKK